MSEKAICPTCGEKRHLEDCGECLQCWQVTNRLNGRKETAGENEFQQGSVRAKVGDPFDQNPFYDNDR